MLIEGAFEILVLWVLILLIIEAFIDLACILSSIRWLLSINGKYALTALRLGALAAIFHAFRVLIYVMGRTGPWKNFDVKPEYHETYTFSWFWVYFAAILSIAGIVGVIVIWYLINRRNRTDGI